MGGRNSIFLMTSQGDFTEHLKIILVILYSNIEKVKLIKKTFHSLFILTESLNVFESCIIRKFTSRTGVTNAGKLRELTNKDYETVSKTH